MLKYTFVTDKLHLLTEILFDLLRQLDIYQSMKDQYSLDFEACQSLVLEIFKSLCVRQWCLYFQSYENWSDLALNNALDCSQVIFLS